MVCPNGQFKTVRAGQHDASDVVGKNYFEIYPFAFEQEAQEVKRTKAIYNSPGTGASQSGASANDFSDEVA